MAKGRAMAQDDILALDQQHLLLHAQGKVRLGKGQRSEQSIAKLA